MPQETYSTAPGVEHASDMHAPAGSYVHASLHETSRVCGGVQPAPLRVRSPGVHSPSPVHEPVVSHVHDAVQRAVRVPQRPQGMVSVVPGTHIPSSAHGPYAHSRSAVQKRSRDPHEPQLTVSIAPGVSHVSGGPASSDGPASCEGPPPSPGPGPPSLAAPPSMLWLASDPGPPSNVVRSDSPHPTERTTSIIRRESEPRIATPFAGRQRA